MKQPLYILITGRNWQTIPTLSNFIGHLRRCVDDYDWSVNQQTAWQSTGGGAFVTLRNAVRDAVADKLV